MHTLNSAGVHAWASHAALDLRCTTTPPYVDRRSSQRVKWRMRNNGQVFDLSTVQPSHLGMSILRERASARGAHLTIESQADPGT